MALTIVNNICMDASRGATVGLKVKALIDQRGWSLGTLAQRSGLDKGYLSQLTRGKVANPGYGTLGKISTALGVSLSEITGETPVPRRRVTLVEGSAAIPVLRRRVHANGHPYWDDTDETVYVGAQMYRDRPNIKAATVTGQCMEPHVLPGERVIFDPDQRPNERDMVVATDNEGAIMVKWYRVDPLGRPYLRAADGTEIRPNGARIEGVVIATYRGAVRDPLG